MSKTFRVVNGYSQDCASTPPSSSCVLIYSSPHVHPQPRTEEKALGAQRVWGDKDGSTILETRSRHTATPLTALYNRVRRP
jgi:hypothetical protein